MTKHYPFKKIHLSLLLFCFFLLQSLMAQSTVFKVTILDEQSKETLPFAIIELTQGKNIVMKQATDVNGEATFQQAPAGTFTIRISYLGYESKSITYEINKKKKEKLEVKLKPQVHELSTCEIVSYSRCCSIRRGCGGFRDFSCCVLSYVDSTAKEREATSIVEKAASNIRLYPNPATDVFHVQAEGEVSEMVLSDLSGKQLRRINTQQQWLVSIDVSDLARGVYLVTYVKDNKRETQRICLN